MPIDQEINKVLKEMWRLNENLSSGISLSQSEIIFYNSHLKDIKEYYSKNNDYWDMAVEVVTPKIIS